MIKEIIFILILVVAILIAVASNPQRNRDSETTVQSTVTNQLPQIKKKKNVHVRFSPEKKERTYSVKTGRIINDSVAQVEDIELDE